MATVRVFKSYLKTPFLVLLALEIPIVFFSVYSALYLRFINSPGRFLALVEDLWQPAAFISVVTPFVMLAVGLYQGHIREGMSGILLRLLITMLAVGLISSLFFFFFPSLAVGRGILGLTLAQAFFVIGTLRAIFFELVDTDTFKKNVLVYGAGKTASHIETKLRRRSDRREFSIVGFILLEHQKHEQSIDDSKLIPRPASLLDYAHSNDIDEIVVATSDIDADIPVDDLVQCKMHGIDVVDILTFFEREVGQIRVDILDPRWLIFADGYYQSDIKDKVKRVFDLLVSVLILLLASPFLLVAMLAIKIEDGISAPVFYHQTRVGKLGIPYRVFKLRSMTTNAETKGKAIWASKTDSRVTRVGKFIRKTRIDEIPQIYNVLNGTMSFVGPRPERPEFVEKLAEVIPYYHERHLVKPGITGWAQLMYPYGSSISDSYQKQLFDMYYIKNQSLFLDFLILLQTVEVVIFGKGAR